MLVKEKGSQLSLQVNFVNVKCVFVCQKTKEKKKEKAEYARNIKVPWISFSQILFLSP